MLVIGLHYEPWTCWVSAFLLWVWAAVNRRLSSCVWSCRGPWTEPWGSVGQWVAACDAPLEGGRKRREELLTRFKEFLFWNVRGAEGRSQRGFEPVTHAEPPRAMRLSWRPLFLLLSRHGPLLFDEQRRQNVPGGHLPQAVGRTRTGGWPGPPAPRQTQPPRSHRSVQRSAPPGGSRAFLMETPNFKPWSDSQDALSPPAQQHSQVLQKSSLSPRFSSLCREL